MTQGKPRADKIGSTCRLQQSISLQEPCSYPLARHFPFLLSLSLLAVPFISTDVLGSQYNTLSLFQWLFPEQMSQVASTGVGSLSVANFSVQTWEAKGQRTTQEYPQLRLILFATRGVSYDTSNGYRGRRIMVLACGITTRLHHGYDGT